MKTKLIATTAIAALAVPAAASAAKPAQKPAKAPKSHAFTLGGVGVSGLSVTDGKLDGAVTLDPTSANHFARTFLGLSKADIQGDKTVPVGTAGDAVVIKYNGLTSTDALQPTDRIKLIGRAGQTLDIRKIVVTRPDTQDQQSEQTDAEQPKTDEPKADQPKSGQAASTQQGTSHRSAQGTENAQGPKATAAANKNAPGQACKAESKKKLAGQTKSAFAICVSGYKKQQQAEEQASATGDTAPSPAETCKGQSKKKVAGQKKTAFASCVSGAKKAEKTAEQQS